MCYLFSKLQLQANKCINALLWGLDVNLPNEDTLNNHAGSSLNVPERWWWARSFFTPALLQLFDMIDAVTSLCSDSPFQQLWIKIYPCWRLHIKLVVRVVFHVETKRPALQPLLSITLRICLYWIHQDKKWLFFKFMILLSKKFLFSDQNVCHETPNLHVSYNLQLQFTIY